MEWLEVIGPVTALLGVLGAIFNYSVIRPLSEAINNLNDAIEKMQTQLHEVDAKRQEMAERLAKVETSAKSAHHRIDTLENHARFESSHFE